MGPMSMTDAGTTQDNFILPALPVGGLPISQDRLDRMKLVRTRQIHNRLDKKVYLFITPAWLGTQQQNVFIDKM